MKEVVILGDSWSSGVWGTTGTSAKLTPKDLGFEKFFKQHGYRTTNLSKPGDSNKNQIQRLENFLQTNTGNDKIFIMVQTDPFRSIRPYDTLSDLIVECKGLLSAISYVRKTDYDFLEKVCEKYQVQIYLIGGLSSVVPSEINNKHLVTPLVASWPKLLLENISDYKDIVWDEFCTFGSDWTIQSISINQLMNNGSLNDIFSNLAEQVIEELHILDKNGAVLKHSYFAPDYAHPNLEAHKILFDNIFEIVTSGKVNARGVER